MNLDKIIIFFIFAILVFGAFFPIVSYLLIGILAVLIIAFRLEYIFFDFLLNNKIILAIIISMFISSIFSDLWYISIPVTLLYIMKILFSSIISYYLDEIHINRIIIILLVLGIVISSIGIVQYYCLNINMPSSWVDTSLYDISFRAYSTFYNPNILAVFLGITILTGIVKYESVRSGKVRILSLICLVLSILCILLTYSRNGWLSVSIMLIVLSLLDKKYIKYAILFPIIFLSFELIGKTGRLLPENLLADSSIHYRIEIWKSSLNIIKDNLLLGVGPGTIWQKIPLYSMEIKSYVSHAHNIYLQKLVDTGVIGLFLLICFLKYIWDKIKKDVFSNKEVSVIAFGFYIILLVNGVVDATGFQSQISIFLWAFIGINCRKKKYRVKAS